MPTKPSSKTTFVLKHLNASQTILSHYVKVKKPINFDQDHQGDDETLPQTLIQDQETIDIPVSELLYEKSKRAYYFLDTHKTQNKYWCNMIDVLNNGPLPSSTSKPCWWCRHSFGTRPIGCPTHYYPCTTAGVDTARVKEKLEDAGLPIDTLDFFETDGMFCSFPCVKAFILDNGNKAKYKNSAGLLTLLFKLVHGMYMPIPRAGPWTTLKVYGGHLTIVEFRAAFGKLAYEETNGSRRPYMFASARYISENKIKLFRGVKE
jgi:hypothetical protein